LNDRTTPNGVSLAALHPPRSLILPLDADKPQADQPSTEKRGTSGPIFPVPFLTLFPSIMLPLFIGVMDQTIVATALPAIAASLGEVEQIAWVVVAYLIAVATIAPVYGRLGDTFGRKRMMFVAIAVTVAGSLVCASSASLGMLIGGRFLQGLGGGGLMGLSHALVGQSVPPRDRARYQGYFSTIMVSASTAGPVIGGFMTEHFGWRSIFLLNIPLCLAAALLLLRLASYRPPPQRFRFDFPGLLLLFLFVASLLIFVEQVRHMNEMDAVSVGGLLLLTLLSLILLFLREKRATSPLLPIPLLSNPNIWRLDLIALCHGGLFVSLISLLPIYLSAVRGFSPSDIGFTMLPMTGLVGFGSFLTGKLVARTGRTMIFPSLGLSTCAVLLVILAFVVNKLGIVGLGIYMGTLSFFLGGVMAAVQVTVLSEAGAMLGTTTATVQLSRSLGAAMGTAIASAVLFTAITLNGTEVSKDVLALLQGAGSLDTLGAGAAEIRNDVASAFSYVFLAVATFAALAAFFAWTVPHRRL
jgi:EmrB/QacA subfamily drug resistance transporter